MITPVQLPLAPGYHNNRQLFSDYYLDEILPRHPGWLSLAAQAAPVRERIAAIFAGYRPSQNEAQTERDLIRPVLEVLGHTFDVQATLKTPDGNKKPDYVFYRDLDALNANKDRVLTDALTQQGGLAVGDAKYWDRPLDQALKGAGDPFTNKNPSFQIYFYMLYSGVGWGILTNGRLWRLYHRDSAHKLDTFYEVDLPALLARPNQEAFLYFYSFFAREAFEAGPVGVAEILKQSQEYARGVGDTLKAQVYDALRHLAQGFLDYPANRLSPDPATLKRIYDASLILLYRLLFVLYAEARELLPLRDDQYRTGYSLFAIKNDVARSLDLGRALRPNSGVLWPRLRELFRIVDQGDPALGVATYNGGLFDPARHPFLEEMTVGDAHLQQAIDMLARVAVKQQSGGAKREFVDYRDLAVRHLGTIYEGLLEYHPAPASEEGWSVALLNKKGERKSSGSYYTPDYIVKYMVDQTLGPVLDAAVAGKDSDAARAEAVLALNVLDPAMGSGHFLVEATEYMARRLVELDVRLPGDETREADIHYWRRRVASSSMYGVDLNPLAVELAKLSLWLSTVSKDRPLSFLDHHLRTGNSLIGARLADLQLETAAGAPKKRTGNKREQQAAAAGQLSMLDVPGFQNDMRTAVGNMWLIEESPGLTIEQVKEQEQIYGHLRQDLTRRYGLLADLATARHFGLELNLDREQWQALADFATGRAVAILPRFQAWLDQAGRLAAERRFFHWELEFPEVFFDRFGGHKGDAAGFDAVIGNPPYVRQEALGPQKDYFQAAFPETYHGVADLYVYFFHQGLELTRAGGRMSYIVTNKWMRAGYGEPLRGYFAAQGAMKQIIDFGHAPIFPEADVFPAIVVLEKPSPGGTGDGTGAQVQVTVFPREMLRTVELDRYVADHHIFVPHTRLTSSAWGLETSAVDDLMAKIRRVGVPLTEFARAKPYYGVKTGFNEAFLIDSSTRERLIREDNRSRDIIKPFLRGQDIKRWVSDWAGLWIIFTRRGVDIEQYPALKHHLEQFREQLEPKPKDWIGGTWPGRKPGSYQWYETQDPVEYWKAFESPKIVYQVIQFYPQYSFDISGVLTNDKGFFIPSSDFWLLAVLNSPLMWWHNWRYLPHMKDEALNPAGVLMEKAPIAPPTDAIRAEVEPAVERMIAITSALQQNRKDTLDWLRTEFGVETPGQRLEEFAELDADSFVDEVKKRRARSVGHLTPAALKALRSGYAEQATPARELRAEAAGLERRVAELVNQAYGLTPEEVVLMWETAPPRMPRF